MLPLSLPSRSAAVSLAVVLALASTPTASGQDTETLEPDPGRLEIDAGRSVRYDAPWPVRGVSVTDPDVADVEVLTPELLLLSGRAPGSTDLVMWGESGVSETIQLVVSADLDSLSATLQRHFPGASLDLSESQGAVVVSGLLVNAGQVEALHAFFEGAEIKFVDMTSLPGLRQVQVQVRVAEVSRTYLRTLGINAFGVGNDAFVGSTIGPSNGGAINPISIGPPEGASAMPPLPFTFNQPVNVNPAVTLFAGFPRADLEIFLQALAENQYLRILAEPTLVALSGEEASFLAGGEFPIPVVQGATGTSTSITIEYKEFGVHLKFRPQVRGEGMIRMHVMAEVSELSDRGAVEIQGFRVPSVATRRTDTTLEMGSGQTFAMAGLINEETAAQVSRTPFLGDLPVLGAFFRSVRYRTGETELLVLVSASLVEPISTTKLPPLPGTTHMPPGDWEMYALGTIEGATPAPIGPGEAATLRELGLDALEGPGAWEKH